MSNAAKIATELTPVLVNSLNRDSAADLAIRHRIGNTSSEWNNCIASDLATLLLDEIFPFLWLVAVQSGDHIDALHCQALKNRNIIVTEDPKLHLVWYFGTIYIKPLPDYLLNASFWCDHIPQPAAESFFHRKPYDKYRTALGYIRSYSFLIRHESDFIIAQKANLLPKYVSFQRLQRFLQPFRSVQDHQVSHRYQYGQFRLTRLNSAMHVVRLLQVVGLYRGKQRLPWYYQEQLFQSLQYIQRYAAPLVFIFAVLSIILQAMQVVLTALGEKTWRSFVRVSWGFSVAAILFAATPFAVVVVASSMLAISQGQYAVRAQMRRTQRQKDPELHSR